VEQTVVVAGDLEVEDAVVQLVSYHTQAVEASWVEEVAAEAGELDPKHLSMAVVHPMQLSVPEVEPSVVVLVDSMLEAVHLAEVAEVPMKSWLPIVLSIGFWSVLELLALSELVR
jgi:hypothetical protein